MSPSVVIIIQLVSVLLLINLNHQTWAHQPSVKTERHIRPEEPELSVEHEHYDDQGEHDPDYDRELVGGTEADQFKRLTPEESKERLGLLFGKMDKDQDGKLTKDELKEWIIHSLKDWDLKEGTSRFNSYDSDKDGWVTWPEYVSQVMGHSLEDIEHMRKDSSNETRQIIENFNLEKLRFDTGDLDKDGRVNLTEFIAIDHTHNYKHMAPYEVQRTLHDYDTNRDGMIDLKEYMTDESNMSEDVLKSEREYFKQLDKNNDGKLDREEIAHWVTPGFDKIALEEVDHLFKTTDKDKKGFVTKEQVQEDSDYWVGSQATDYGRHLEDEL